MLVDVAVHPALREYITCTHNGSSVIYPDKGSRLWGLVSMYLSVQPTVRTREEPAESSIQIAIYNSHAPVWCVDKRRTIHQDTLFRNYLTPKGQKAIAKHLMETFKQTYRAYMQGALSNNVQLTITDAIDEFCNDYRITCERITYDMLRKDWYRHRLKTSGGEIAPGSWDK